MNTPAVNILVHVLGGHRCSYLYCMYPRVELLSQRVYAGLDLVGNEPLVILIQSALNQQEFSIGMLICGFIEDSLNCQRMGNREGYEEYTDGRL